MNRFFLIAPLIALLIIPQLSIAQIYKSTDEEGNVTFSDSPPPGSTAQPVKLRETNTAPPPPESPGRPAAAATADTRAAVSYSVAIVSPANETTIAMGPGNFSVSASVEPALDADQSLQLYMDGSPWGDPQRGSSWALTNVFRGAHDLTVAVTDPDGNRLAGSEPVRVYVLRPSVNFRK